MNDPKPTEAEAPSLVPTPDEDAGTPHEDGGTFDDGAGYDD